jgi:hypothetical protein
MITNDNILLFLLIIKHKRIITFIIIINKTQKTEIKFSVINFHFQKSKQEFQKKRGFRI